MVNLIGILISAVVLKESLAYNNYNFSKNKNLETIDTQKGRLKRQTPSSRFNSGFRYPHNHFGPPNRPFGYPNNHFGFPDRHFGSNNQNSFNSQGQFGLGDQNEFNSNKQPSQNPTTSRSFTTPPAVPGMETTRSPCEDACLITSQYDPVCGDNLITYSNPARLKCAQRCGRRVSLLRIGSCPPPPRG